MLRKFAPQRVPKRLRKRNQEETPEQRNGGLFIDAPDGFSKGQSQSSDSHDGAGGEKDSSRPAVNLRRARAQAAHELQRAQHHEEHRGQDVRQHQRAFAREMRVQVGRWIPRRAQSAGFQQNDGSPRSDRVPDQSEKNDRGPKESHERAIRLLGLRSSL